MCFGSSVALGQQFGRKLGHDIAVFCMDHRSRTQFGQSVEAGEQFVVVHHQRAFVGQEVLERVDTAVLNDGFHVFKHLLAPPCHSHVE